MSFHRFDPFSALAGLLSLAFAIAIGARTGPVGLTELQLTGPIAILVLGIALVASGGRTAADPPLTASAAAPGRAGHDAAVDAASEPEGDQAGTDQQAGDRGDAHRGDG